MSPTVSRPSFFSDCMYMTSDEGEFYHKATIADGSVCGIYMYSDSDQRIEVRFNYLDVPCENGGLVAVINVDCLSV